MPSRKASVLVVDDDVRILRMMTRILELEGYRVLKAIDGEAALEVLVEETPDLVLLDIMMPGMDGYALCRCIREFSPVPIVMVTARCEVTSLRDAVVLGADDYVRKPFYTRELLARIRAKLRRAGAEVAPSLTLTTLGIE